MSARDLARWAADAFATYDLAATHRIVTATCGSVPLPDYVSARFNPFSRTVELPRPVGVVLARVAPGTLDEAVRRSLLTRNALLVETESEAVAARVRELASRAEAAGAPAGVLQMLDSPGPVDAVLEPVAETPVVVIVDKGAQAPVADSDAIVLAVGAGYTDLGHAIRAARGILRDTGADRVRVYSDDPLRVAAFLPVTRVAVGDDEMPAAAPDGLVTWTRIGTDRLDGQPWVSPTAPLPAYPRPSNEAS